MGHSVIHKVRCGIPSERTFFITKFTERRFSLPPNRQLHLKFDIPEIHFFKQYLVRGNVEEISVEEYAKLDEKNASGGRWSPIFSDIWMVTRSPPQSDNFSHSYFQRIMTKITPWVFLYLFWHIFEQKYLPKTYHTKLCKGKKYGRYPICEENFVRGGCGGTFLVSYLSDYSLKIPTPKYGCLFLYKKFTDLIYY